MIATMYHAKNLKINIEGMEFDYIRFGNGTKPLIMIQGLNARGIKNQALPLAYMYRLFARDYKVYLFDRRPIIDEEITLKDFALDIAKAMDLLGIKNADVLGVSQGGMIAQYLAIHRPDLIRKLVLAFTLSRNNDTVKKVIHRWIDLVEANDMKSLVIDMAEKMYSYRYIKRYRLFMPLLTILQKPKDIKRFVLQAKTCLTCDTYEQLENIKCPILVIGGGKDQIVTDIASEEMAIKLNCQLHMYEDLGHGAYEEAKDFNQIVYQFFINIKAENPLLLSGGMNAVS